MEKSPEMIERNRRRRKSSFAIALNSNNEEDLIDNYIHSVTASNAFENIELNYRVASEKFEDDGTIIIDSNSEDLNNFLHFDLYNRQSQTIMDRIVDIVDSNTNFEKIKNENDISTFDYSTIQIQSDFWKEHITKIRFPIAYSMIFFITFFIILGIDDVKYNSITAIIFRILSIIIVPIPWWFFHKTSDWSNFPSNFDEISFLDSVKKIRMWLVLLVFIMGVSIFVISCLNPIVLSNVIKVEGGLLGLIIFFYGFVFNIIPLPFIYSILLSIFFLSVYIILFVVVSLSTIDTPFPFISFLKVILIHFFCAISSTFTSRDRHLLTKQFYAQARIFSKEKIRSEGLLHSLLPPEIETEMKISKNTSICSPVSIKKRKGTATISFVDISVLDSKGEPILIDLKYVSILNMVFSRIDKIMELYRPLGVSKIESVSSTYLFYAGLMPIIEDHAHVVCEAAFTLLALITILKTTESHYLRCKIGIHTGLCIGGIIGSSRKFWRIFGDAVNTASRMCNYGPDNCIQVSHSVYEEINKHSNLPTSFKMVWRGKIDIKGKGLMDCYIIDQEDNDSSALLNPITRVRSDSYRIDISNIDPTDSDAIGLSELKLSLPEKNPDLLTSQTEYIPQSKSNIIPSKSNKNTETEMKVVLGQNSIVNIDRERNSSNHKKLHNLKWASESRLKKSNVNNRKRRELHIALLTNRSLAYTSISRVASNRISSIDLASPPKFSFKNSFVYDRFVRGARINALTLRFTPNINLSDYERNQSNDNEFFDYQINEKMAVLNTVSNSFLSNIQKKIFSNLTLAFGIELNFQKFFVNSFFFSSKNAAGAMFLFSILIFMDYDLFSILFSEMYSTKLLYTSISIFSLIFFIVTIFTVIAIPLLYHWLIAIMTISFTIWHICSVIFFYAKGSYIYMLCLLLYILLLARLMWSWALPLALCSSTTFLVVYNIYITESIIPSIHIVMTLIGFSSIHYMKEMMVRERFVFSTAVIKERDQIDQLLRTLLPTFVIEKLKISSNNSILIPDRFPQCTVFESDLQGFTTLCSTIDAETVISMLNQLYSYYDSCVEKRGLEKIDTIGDSFIACNFSHGDPETVVQFSLDALSFLSNHKMFKARIGISTGTVIGGVAGNLIPRYHIYGPALIAANMLEKICPVGKILVCNETYRRCSKNFKFEQIDSDKFGSIPSDSELSLIPLPIFSCLGISKRGSFFHNKPEVIYSKYNENNSS